MLVDILKGNSVLFRYSDRYSTSETIYSVRFQDHTLPVISDGKYLETYGNGYAVRELQVRNGVLTITNSFGGDRFDLMTTPISFYGHALYITFNHRVHGIGVHDWDSLVGESDILTEMESKYRLAAACNYVGYTDNKIAVFNSEHVGVYMVEEDGNRVSKGFDTEKFIFIVYSDFDVTALCYSLNELSFTDILPMYGQLVKFDRAKHQSDIKGDSQVGLTYITSPVSYDGNKRDMHEKLLRTDGRVHKVNISFPRSPIGFCGMNIINNKHLLLYKLPALSPPKSSYILFEISWVNKTEFVLTDQIEFHVQV